MSNTIAGKLVDIMPRSDGDVLIWDATTDKYIHAAPGDLIDVSFETLFAKDDAGPGAEQLAIGNHDHNVGNLQLLFENKII